MDADSDAFNDMDNDVVCHVAADLDNNNDVENNMV
jgi:hypothetical protein